MTEEVELRVEGMHCQGCANALTNALRRRDGVLDAHVSHTERRARIRYDEARTDPSRLREAVERAGYLVPDPEAPP